MHKTNKTLWFLALQVACGILLYFYDGLCVTWLHCVLGAFRRYDYFIRLWCFFMYSAVICRYCICYEQPTFPKRSETNFWTYKVNIKFDLEFWWLSIVSLTRLWNGVGPHGCADPGFVIVNFGLLFRYGKIILLFSRPWILLLWTVWQCIEYCLWFS